MRPLPLLWFAVSCALSAGCGGKAASDRTPPARVAELRFERVAAGQDSFCGITAEGRLACVKDDAIFVDRPGPYVDVSLNDDIAGWDCRCAVLATGGLECDGVGEYLPPSGSYVRVSVSFFNACALDAEGRVSCWLPEALGGTPGLTGNYQDFSAGGMQACAVDRGLQVSCVGRTAVAPPEHLHFWKVAASGDGACGLLLPVSGIQAEAGAWCWTSAGAKEVLPGFFQTLSVNLGGQGCAGNDMGEVRCFGGQEELFSATDGPYSNVSVSGSQACALRRDGSVDCRRLR